VNRGFLKDSQRGGGGRGGGGGGGGSGKQSVDVDGRRDDNIYVGKGRVIKQKSLGSLVGELEERYLDSHLVTE
jgi:hypothetical protein